MWRPDWKQWVVIVLGFFPVSLLFLLAMTNFEFEGNLWWAMTAIMGAGIALVLYWLETKK